MVLPVVTLVAVVYAQYLLVMRSSLLDEMGSDYLTTARAKGLRDDEVRRRHAVPNALLPTVTLVFVNLGFVVAGAILVETVFSWPGLGGLFYEALSVPDLPLVQGLFVVFAAAVILMNIARRPALSAARPAGGPMTARDARRHRPAARTGGPRALGLGAPASGGRRVLAAVPPQPGGGLGLVVLAVFVLLGADGAVAGRPGRARASPTATGRAAASRRAVSSRSAPTSPAARCSTWCCGARGSR